MLVAGLRAKGIERDLAEKTVSSLFLDLDERTMCLKAIKKLRRTGKEGIKLVLALQQKGFSRKIVTECLGME